MLGLSIQAAREDKVSDDEILGEVTRVSPQLRDSISAAMSDGHSASSVLDFLQNEYQPKGVVENASRQSGLAARAVAPAVAGGIAGAALGAPIAGVGAIPGAAAGMTAGALTSMVGDPLVSLYNRMTGSNVTAPSKALDDLLTKSGLPRPITRMERIAQSAMTGAAGGLSGAAAAKGMTPLTQPGTAGRAVLDGLSRSPGSQAVATAAGASAGQYVAEEGATPGVQMAASLGAGLLAPGAATTAPKAAGRAGGLLVSPFSQAGREAIVGNVLNKFAHDPDAARAKMYEYEPRIPGSRATVAGASRDPGLMGAEGAIRSAFDTTGQFANRISANNQARLDLINRIARDETTVAGAKEKRTAVTRPMREQSFSGASPADLQTPIIAKIDSIMASPSGAGMQTEVAMDFVRSRLPKAGNDHAKMYEVRKDVQNAIMGRFDSDNSRLSAAKGQLIDVLRTIDETIEASAPGYTAYMDQFRKNSRPINQMGLLQGIRDKTLTAAKNAQTDDDVIGAANWTRQMRARAEEIGTTLSPQQQSILKRISQDINDGVAPATSGRVPGSDTIRNMTIANIVGRALNEKFATNATIGTITRPLQWMYKLPEERVQALLVDAMLDPKMAADLMAKANVVRVGGISDRLKQRAIDLGMVSATGAVQGEARRVKDSAR